MEEIYKKIHAVLILFLMALLGCEEKGDDQAEISCTAFTTPSSIIDTTPIPITGTPVEGMASFDTIIPDLMSKWQIPGGAVAVVKDGRLVYARGYGWADVETNESVQPDSLFRIGSISKPITAVTILKLVEEGQLDLDAKVFELLDYLKPPDNATVVDSRINDITVRQLLYHSGGWDRELSFDPMFIPIQAAEAVDALAPASCETVIRYMLGQPLDFSPGSQYAYSNFGYCVLGRIIERITGQSYEDYVGSYILESIGVTQMQIGHSLLEDRVEGEVRYYDHPGATFVQSVFPEAPGCVTRPYGGFYLEALDSLGGWIAPTIDLLRFMVAVDGRDDPSDILGKETIDLMTSRPPPPLWVDTDYYYGMGWGVTPVGSGANWWHGGANLGTSAFMVRTHSGLAWAALFNSLPPLSQDSDTFFAELDISLWQAINEVTEWPEQDLFKLEEVKGSSQHAGLIRATGSGDQ